MMLTQFEFTIYNALIYFPPIWVWAANQKLLAKAVKLLNWKMIVGVSIFLNLLAYFRYPYWAIMIYTTSFLTINLVCRQKGFDDLKSFRLSVYATYGITELYEIPVHISTWIDFESLAVGTLYSMWGALAASLFFFSIWRAGWRPRALFTVMLINALMMILLIRPPWTENMVMWLHVYRLPWMMVFLSAVLEVENFEGNNVNTRS